MTKKTENEKNQKFPLPGSCKRVAALIPDKAIRAAYIRNMIDAENVYQNMKRKSTKDKE